MWGQADVFPQKERASWSAPHWRVGVCEDDRLSALFLLTAVCQFLARFRGVSLQKVL